MTSTRAALEALADRTNPICDACDQPIVDPEPCDLHVNGHTVFFHPDCCPECQDTE